jgi:uncharacterized membrane protein YidH (DUF202 family)
LDDFQTVVVLIGVGLIAVGIINSIQNARREERNERYRRERD